MRSRTIVPRRFIARGAVCLLCAFVAAGAFPLGPAPASAQIGPADTERPDGPVEAPQPQPDPVPTPSADPDQKPKPEPVFAISADRPPSANALFIAGAYDELLRRPVDDDGAAFWLDDIVSGGERSREILANKLLFSPEGASNEVVEAYADLLNRYPEREGWDHWATLLQTHRVDELRVLIMTSEEYILINGGPDEYVNALYVELLNREAEDDGETFWEAELARGVPRKVIVEAIFRSDEGLAGRASSYYQRFLNRKATTTERAEGVRLIETHGERVLAAHVFASDESFDGYFDQALQAATTN